MRHARARVERLAWLCLAAATGAGAQVGDDVPRAPRLGAADVAGSAPVSTTSLRPPSASRLAPLPTDRPASPDEIVVIGQGWRLPDLGSAWRARQQEAEREHRLHAVFLPLYDPNRPPLRADTFWQSREEQRHGSIELFRLRFGRPKEE
jgi:hypothetical protein